MCRWRELGPVIRLWSPFGSALIISDAKAAEVKYIVGNFIRRQFRNVLQNIFVTEIAQLSNKSDKRIRL